MIVTIRDAETSEIIRLLLCRRCNDVVRRAGMDEPTETTGLCEKCERLPPEPEEA